MLAFELKLGRKTIFLHPYIIHDWNKNKYTSHFWTLFSNKMEWGMLELSETFWLHHYRNQWIVWLRVSRGNIYFHHSLSQSVPILIYTIFKITNNFLIPSNFIALTIFKAFSTQNSKSVLDYEQLWQTIFFTKYLYLVLLSLDVTLSF